MKLTCEYCDHIISDTDEECPNCGAPNKNIKRTANKVPKTLEEQKIFVQSIIFL